MAAEDTQLIFIPGPKIGHIAPAMEVGKLILGQNSSLSITYLLINDPHTPKQVQESIQSNSNPRLRFLNLPEAETPISPSSERTAKLSAMRDTEHINRHMPQVREAVLGIINNSTARVAGLMIDMFCMNMIAVGEECGIPSYVFYTSSAAFLSFHLFFQSLCDEHEQDITGYRGSDKEFLVPGFINPVPAKVMPSMMLDRNGGSEMVMISARKIRRAQGIFINTFEELEATLIQALIESNGSVPPVYPIGPVINLNSRLEQHDDSIINWLDTQPDSSVVFLCFGSQGSFSETQIKHLATAIESCGHRFLWSLRSPKGASLAQILPQGFLKRTSGVGKVTGWAPQSVVLSHPAVGGFVSHCGWNSVLESVRFGVPIAAWPIAAEQQVNAFQAVVELGIAAEIRMDYRGEWSEQMPVDAETIEKAINRIMTDAESIEIRKKVMDLKKKGIRALLAEDGSRQRWLGRLIHDILQNSAKC